MDDWAKGVVGGAVVGLLGVIAAAATGWFSFASKDEELPTLTPGVAPDVSGLWKSQRHGRVRTADE